MRLRFLRRPVRRPCVSEAREAARAAAIDAARAALEEGRGIPGDVAFARYVPAVAAASMRPYLFAPKAVEELHELYAYWERTSSDYADTNIELLVENIPGLLPAFTIDPCTAPVSQCVFLYFSHREDGATWFYHFAHPGTAAAWAQ